MWNYAELVISMSGSFSILRNNSKGHPWESEIRQLLLRCCPRGIASYRNSIFIVSGYCAVSYVSLHSLFLTNFSCTFFCFDLDVENKVFILSHRSYHNISPPDPWKWKWSNAVGKKWNEHFLMYIYYKQCEIKQKFLWKWFIIKDYSVIFFLFKRSAPLCFKASD